ncbi:hypothetical protein [Burkholderia vietnamiensis]|jgi:hypothetical protein|uniref:hypothetical protein n=1 Tax=Burkholderia vietnamiensis TaxID=60552 RepID=UPI0010416E63|nr:hypothetical protein [Burkholderia vietnamiensis]
MRGVPNQRFDLGNNNFYTIKPDHRDATLGKSQWKVTETQEVEIFHAAYTAKWVVNNTAWGLYRPEQMVQMLGLDKTHASEVFIAKFVRDDNAPDWHGYPVAHTVSADVPDTSVLGAWQAEKILPGAKLRKIAKMQPCKL